MYLKLFCYVAFSKIYLYYEFNIDNVFYDKYQDIVKCKFWNQRSK